MNPLCTGFRPASREPLPPAWRRWLDQQTLREAPGAENAFVLRWHGLPELSTVELGHTWLEMAAWSLITRPEIRAVVWPLYADLDPSRPRALLPCDQKRLARLCSGGYLLLSPEDLSALEATPAGLAALPSDTVLVATRALLEPRLTHLQPAAVRGGRHGAQWLKDQIRRRLGLRQKIWLKRQLQRLRLLPRAHSAVPATAEPLLARCKQWAPAIEQPALALRSQPKDTRIPVLFAVHWLELGGAERFAVDLIRALPTDQYAVHLITEIPSENPWAALIRAHVEAIIHLPESLPDYAAGIFYEHYIRTRGIRLLHIHHGARAYESLFHIRRFHPTLKILDTLHILELPPHSGGYPEHMARHFGAFLDGHHVISRHLGAFLMERWLVPEARVHVIHLNVDSQSMDPARVEAGLLREPRQVQADALVVGFVGRFNRQKRPLAFVDMAERLLQRWQSQEQPRALHFFMAGSGPLLAAVRKRIAQTPALGAVMHLVGELDDVRPFYRDCDLIAMPSENEGLALVAYEAMAMALPVIFTDVGAQHELLPPACLVPPDGAVGQDLAAAVWPLLIEDAQRLALGQRNRAYVVQHHPARQTFERVLALYATLLANPQQMISVSTAQQAVGSH